ncbi:adhesion G protein-coupled receptor E2-like isoform X1 [Megalops cyprinoides]|uniref:adhesion G protein-coupled receptor E2-like isoform X1 n=1 Tax=Megalops cyprinoides TaxID=118141 RepID=UPI001864C337|nr:adhesion G protein-coupled receptor E2-like isoform X1 [Megalops cyprinoides]
MGPKLHPLILGLLLTLLGKTMSQCSMGYEKNQTCIDIDECKAPVCGKNAICFNTIGSYYCQCVPGFRAPTINFTAFTGQCEDVNECQGKSDFCGPNAKCKNTIGSHTCSCLEGYVSSNGEKYFDGTTGVMCKDEDECSRHPPVCGRNGTCSNSPGTYTCSCDAGFSNSGHSKAPCSDINECAIDEMICGKGGSCNNTHGGYVCMCNTGYSNYGKASAQCVELNCDKYNPSNKSEEVFPGLTDLLSLMRDNCRELNGNKSPGQPNGEMVLEKLLTKLDDLLSGMPVESSGKVTALLTTVENAIRLIGPQMKQPQTRMSTMHTEVELLVRRGRAPPQGVVSMSTEHVQLDTHWETAAGNGTYPGFAMASLVSYKELESTTNHSFPSERGQSFQINSKVVSAIVSNPNTGHLDKCVNFTFSHLKSTNESHTCVFWDAGVWSTTGCQKAESNETHTVCSCTHLSSFAVLMSLHEFKHDPFELQVITWVGLSVSLVCLLLSIATFYFCRSIQGTRNTIHLHLCISLFIADLVFLAGISSTQNKGGCAFVAGLLHFFFLAAFCWMCLEGVQLYRMVVLVFNTTFRPLYMMAVGYGIPAVIVIVSAIINAEGYGTDRHCWLDLDKGFIWSFFGPVCIIIIINAFFFIITVWKLAQKFSSLNPDLSNLRKIKAFTITAIAQLCVLGIMWIFGCFQFEENSLAMSYIFTILNSLQGALVFVMHCLLSKQVRDEYARFLSCICISEKKKYSEFSTNQSSGGQASRSANNTGESQI